MCLRNLEEPKVKCTGGLLFGGASRAKEVKDIKALSSLWGCPQSREADPKLLFPEESRLGEGLRERPRAGTRVRQVGVQGTEVKEALRVGWHLHTRREAPPYILLPGVRPCLTPVLALIWDPTV